MVAVASILPSPGRGGRGAVHVSFVELDLMGAEQAQQPDFEIELLIVPYFPGLAPGNGIAKILRVRGLTPRDIGRK